MPTPTPQGSAHRKRSPPAPPPEFFQSKNWLYDTIMMQIEPDLTTAQIDHLDEKYKGETEEQKTQRHAGYEEAFKLFAQIFKQVTEKVEADVFEKHLKTQRVHAQEEQKERLQENNQAEQLLDSDTPVA